MKQLLLVCLALLGIFSFVVSCNKDDSSNYSKMIIGEWEFVKEEYHDKEGNITSHTAKDYFEDLDEDGCTLQKIKFTREMWYQFYVGKDGSVVESYVAPYYLDDSNNICVDGEEYTIIALSKKQLVFSFDNTKMFFRRIK